MSPVSRIIARARLLSRMAVRYARAGLHDLAREYRRDVRSAVEEARQLRDWGMA